MQNAKCQPTRESLHVHVLLEGLDRITALLILAAVRRGCHPLLFLLLDAATLDSGRRAPLLRDLVRLHLHGFFRPRGGLGRRLLVLEQGLVVGS